MMMTSDAMVTIVVVLLVVATVWWVVAGLFYGEEVAIIGQTLIHLATAPFRFFKRLQLSREFVRETGLSFKEVRAMYTAMLALDEEDEGDYGGDWKTCKTRLGIMHYTVTGCTLHVKVDPTHLFMLEHDYQFTVNSTDEGRIYVDVFEPSKSTKGRGFLGEWRSVYREGEFQKEFAWVRMLKELFLEA